MLDKGPLELSGTPYRKSVVITGRPYRVEVIVRRVQTTHAKKKGNSSWRTKGQKKDRGGPRSCTVVAYYRSFGCLLWGLLSEARTT